MRDKQLKSTIFILLIVALLIFSSIGSLGISTDMVDKEDKIQKSNSILKNKAVRLKTSSPYIITPTKSVQSSNFNTLNINLNISNNIVVANDNGNESYPSIVSNKRNALIAYEYEDNNDPYIYLRKTSNYGKNWSVEAKKLYAVVDNEISTNSPSLCIHPNLIPPAAYGAFTSNHNNSGVYGFFEISDITGNLNNIPVGELDWSHFVYNYSSGDFYSWFDFSHPDIVYHNDVKVPWIIGFIGSTNYTDVDNGAYPINNSIMFSWRDFSEPDTYWLQWDPDLGNCSNLSLDMDDTSTNLFGVCEIKNGSNHNLLFITGDYKIVDTFPEIDLTYQNFTGPENLMHPHIFVKDEQIYIVTESETNGLHEIILYISSDKGGNWTEKTIISNQIPKPNFTFSADRLNISFIDNSTDIDGFITSWDWDFGDGNSSTERDPRHHYKNSGIYTVNLTVRDNDNATNMISKTVTIDNTTPIANFTYLPLNPAKSDLITFNDLSIIFPGRIIKNWTWDFGDGITNDSQNPTHQYEKNGSYIVKLTIKDNESANDSVEKKVMVGLVADFNYEPKYPSIDEKIWFNDSSSDSVGRTIKNWTWNFDNDELIDKQNVTYQFPRPGIYIVNLTIKDNLNATNTVHKYITVRPSQMIPRYPRLFVNDTHISCIFVESRNQFIISSSNDGTNWDAPIQLNNVNGSVVEEYLFSDIPDTDHIVWTDNRDGNNDIYSVVSASPDVDIMIMPQSLNDTIITGDWPFLRTRNWVNFTVINNGTDYVEDIPIEITYTRLNRDPEPIKHSAYIRYLESDGAKKSFKTPLFRLTLIEFIKALINFVGIQNITIKVDPDNRLKDIDPSNNILNLKNVTFGYIFPRLAWLEDFM